MITANLADLQSRLHDTYASQHVSYGGARAAALVYQSDIRPWLPSAAAARSIRQLAAAVGFDSAIARSSPSVCATQVMVAQVVNTCCPVPPAAETGMLRGHIATFYLTFAARKRAGL